MRGAALPLLLLAGCNSLLGFEDLTLVDAEPLDAQSTFVIRQGLDGYAGTVDTYVESATPAATHGTEAELQWSTTNSAHTLLRFDDLFSRIPAGATIRTATLQLNILQAGSATGRLYDAAVEWTAATTYNTLGPTLGVTAEDRGVQVGTVDASASGVATITVTTSLQRWRMDPATNRGWILQPADAAIVTASSSESTAEELRPQLTIEISN